SPYTILVLFLVLLRACVIHVPPTAPTPLATSRRYYLGGNLCSRTFDNTYRITSRVVSPKLSHHPPNTLEKNISKGSKTDETSNTVCSIVWGNQRAMCQFPEGSSSMSGIDRLGVR
ncbi:hypothetical protein AVEN_233892-1, partial [Araneus ventricosus]